MNKKENKFKSIKTRHQHSITRLYRWVRQILGFEYYIKYF